MQLFLTLLNCILLLIILSEDIKDRKVSLYLFVLLFAGMSSLAIQFRSWQAVGKDLLLTVTLLLFLLSFLAIYFSLKAGRWVNPMNSKIGLGDILFWVAIAPLFTPYTFIILLLVSLIFSLTLYLLYAGLARKKPASIPLAGLQSLFMILLFIADYFTGHRIVYFDYNLLPF